MIHLRRIRYLPPGLLTGLVLFSICPVRGQKSGAAVKSRWVFFDTQGQLKYNHLPSGDRILDFSQAGYLGGGKSLPSLPVRVTVSPGPGDNTATIQGALDSVSALPLVDGFRGAVLLLPGIYHCSHALQIAQSGVVLRGSGADKGGTIIRMTGEPHPCIIVRGRPTTRLVGDPVMIMDRYLPSGSDTFTVSAAGNFHVGDTIRISRPVTAAWVHFMGMDELTRNGRAQTWIRGDIPITRVIRSIHGNRFEIDLPLTDCYDARYLNPPGTTVSRMMTTGAIRQIGVERLQIVSQPQSGPISEQQNRGLIFSGVTDCWSRDLYIQNTVNSISVNGSRITLENIEMTHKTATAGSAKPADIAANGTQLLVDRCRISGDNLFFFATGAKVSGPNVLLNCVFSGNGWIQPHQRWATGLLIDHCQVPQGGIDLMNRGEYGSGHGWAIGWAVAWNCSAASFLNQQPPGAANWVIGGNGERQKKSMPFTREPLLKEGIYDAWGKEVLPSSLYLAQLRERSGPGAVRSIGYDPSLP